MADHIRFRQGYKYQLVEDASVQIDMEFPADIYTEYIVLLKSGLLTAKKGYAWDGCSGPTWDDRTNMRG